MSFLPIVNATPKSCGVAPLLASLRDVGHAAEADRRPLPTCSSDRDRVHPVRSVNVDTLFGKEVPVRKQSRPYSTNPG